MANWAPTLRSLRTVLVALVVAPLRPAPAAPLLMDPARRERLYRAWQWRIFLSVTIGYGLFYTTRMPLSVAKKPLLDSGLLSAAQLGQVGSALLASYAVGKAVNGFLGDRIHLQRFFLLGLTLSALTNLLFGVSSSFLLFVWLWGINGWFQSVGATTSGISLGSWFPPRALGTRYGWWSLSHNLGEALTFVVTTALISGFGWRWGFLGPGLLCLVGAAVMTRTLADRPHSLGLTLPPAVPEQEVGQAEVSVLSLQLGVLQNPLVWTLALASACMYVTRYALTNWGMLLLQTEKGQTLNEAGRSLSLFPLVGAVGSVVSGMASDRLFAGRRGELALACGVLLGLGLAAVLYLPGEQHLLLRVALGVAGFATGAQLVFLGGLSAMERCDRRAAGAALGLVGGVSYVGASLQDLTSGRLIQALPGGRYDFAAVKPVWLLAAAASVVLTLPLVFVEQRARRRRVG